MEQERKQKKEKRDNNLGNANNGKERRNYIPPAIGYRACTRRFRTLWAIYVFYTAVF